MELNSRTSDQPVTYGSLPDIYITPMGPSYHPAELPPPPSQPRNPGHSQPGTLDPSVTINTLLFLQNSYPLTTLPQI